MLLMSKTIVYRRCIVCKQPWPVWEKGGQTPQAEGKTLSDFTYAKNLSEGLGFLFMVRATRAVPHVFSVVRGI